VTSGVGHVIDGKRRNDRSDGKTRKKAQAAPEGR